MEIKESLNRVKNISKGVYYLVNTFFYLYCLANVFVAAFSAIALLFPNVLEMNTTEGWVGVIGILVLTIPTAVIIKLIALIFKNISKEETPFTMKQVKRFQWIALLILLDVFVNAVFSTVLGGVSGGLYGIFGVFAKGYTNHLFVYLLEVCSAVVIFCFSFAFEYGFLLQEDINDTV